MFLRPQLSASIRQLMGKSEGLEKQENKGPGGALWGLSQTGT